MKIAVPVSQSGQIDNHFGQCKFYSVYSVSDENVIEDVSTIQSIEGCGCKSNIASVLAEQGVRVMLAGGIGQGAINVLNNAGIEVIKGCSGVPAELVQEFLAGQVKDQGDVCQHHDHHHEHHHENCKHH